MNRLPGAAACVGWALLFALAAGCTDRAQLTSPRSGALTGLRIIPPPEDSQVIPPWESKQLLFQAVDEHGNPAPGVVMSFSIVDDSETGDAGGAHLSLTRGLTDQQGYVQLQVIAGRGATGLSDLPLSFQVHASAQYGSTVVGQGPDVVVFVTNSPNVASVDIVPTWAEPPPTSPLTIQVHFFDQDYCYDFSVNHLPVSNARRVVRTPDPEGIIHYSVVPTDGSHAVFGVAVGPDGKRYAAGCVDLLGTSLQGDSQPGQAARRVVLPLSTLYPSPVGTSSPPVGTYRVVSQFDFISTPGNRPLAAASTVADVWGRLSSRVCDPIGLWLDCTVDALDTSKPEDPLDCVPADEGQVGAVITSLRADPSASGLCADQVDQAQQLSLDAEVYGLFPPTGLAALALGDLPNEVKSMLASLRIESSLRVKPTGSGSKTFELDHTLTSIQLPSAAVHPALSISDLAAVVTTATNVGAQVLPGLNQFVVQQRQDFTLPLGAAARQTFLLSSLAHRVAGADARGFITALFDMATQDESGNLLKGCDALDALICKKIDTTRGCVRSACLSGLDALAQQLDNSFAALDGRGIDFSLNPNGYATLVDRQGNLVADSLTDPSLWTAKFVTQSSEDSQQPISGKWTADLVQGTP